MMAERFFNLKSDRKTPFLAVFSLAAEVRVKENGLQQLQSFTIISSRISALVASLLSKA